jgi:hypothetical protein
MPGERSRTSTGSVNGRSKKGFPTIELRDERQRGVPNAFAWLERLVQAREPSD